MGLLIIIVRAVRGEKRWQLVGAWLVLAPIPASITRESFAVMRATTLLPLPELASAVGAIFIWDTLKKRRMKWMPIVAAGYFLGLFLGLENYLRVLALEYPRVYDWSWQYGYRQAVDIIRRDFDKYDEIYMTKKYGEPHEFLLFYLPWGAEAYREDKYLVRYFRDGWYWVDGFSKFRFVNDWEIAEKVKCGEEKKCLLVTSPGNYPKEVGWNRTETVNYLSGGVVFEMMEK